MKKKKSPLMAALAAFMLFAGTVATAHDELPAELVEALPALSDGSLPGSIGHEHDIHSPNMILVGNFNDNGKYRMGTDMAFWGNLAVAGVYNFSKEGSNRSGGFRLLDISDQRNPKQVGQFDCYGPQNDVSIWKDLVFLSVDTPLTGPDCGAGPASTTAVAEGKGFEGIRVVSIADRANPKQIAFVDTDCGSHTHTLVPDEARGRLLIYVLSYPLGGQGVECNAESHRKISVVEVPLANPAAARVITTPDVSPSTGCHDVTVLVPNKLAGAACITESQLWDISDPANPKVVSHIVNPAINIHHSTTFSYDGKTLVIGDELGGAAASPGCPSDADVHLPLGALWFYDVSNPNLPMLAGNYHINREVGNIYCTAHNFNTVPMKNDRDVLVSAWYNGGTTVVDFTDPANAKELGFYAPQQPLRANPWSSYWYRGFIFANNFDEAIDTGNPDGKSRGFDVFAIADKDLKQNAIKMKRLNPQTMEAP